MVHLRHPKRTSPVLFLTETPKSPRGLKGRKQGKNTDHIINVKGFELIITAVKQERERAEKINREGPSERVTRVAFSCSLSFFLIHVFFLQNDLRSPITASTRPALPGSYLRSSPSPLPPPGQRSGTTAAALGWESLSQLFD